MRWRCYYYLPLGQTKEPRSCEEKKGVRVVQHVRPRHRIFYGKKERTHRSRDCAHSGRVAAIWSRSEFVRSKKEKYTEFVTKAQSAPLAHGPVSASENTFLICLVSARRLSLFVWVVACMGSLKGVARQSKPFLFFFLSHYRDRPRQKKRRRFCLLSAFSFLYATDHVVAVPTGKKDLGGKKEIAVSRCVGRVAFKHVVHNVAHKGLEIASTQARGDGAKRTRFGRRQIGIQRVHGCGNERVGLMWVPA